MLGDGTFDVLVVDVDPDGDDEHRIELVVTSGEHKGTVIPFSLPDQVSDPWSLLGMPYSLTCDGTKMQLRPPTPETG